MDDLIDGLEDEYGDEINGGPTPFAKVEPKVEQVDSEEPSINLFDDELFS